MAGRFVFDWIIVGSQFGATIGAYLAAKNGARVALVDKGDSLCTSIRGKRWGDFQLDFGCQMFSSYGTGVDDPVFEILNGEVVWLDLHLASVTTGRKTEGYEFPDLTAYGPAVSGQILAELVEAACGEDTASDSSASMAAALNQRYGPTAASLIDEIIRAKYGLDTGALAPDTYRMLPFARLVVLPDTAARLLKTIDSLDARIAAPNIVQPRKAANGPVYYPSTGGMAAFCDCAEQKLKSLDVTMRLGKDISELVSDESGARLTLQDGETLEADQVLWATDPDRLAANFGFSSDLSSQIQPIPLVAYYFDIGADQAGPYTYLQSFDDNDMLFRGSVPGSYGKGTCPAGRTYACGEVLTDVESDVWKEPSAYAARIWREMRDHGVVSGPGPREIHIVSAPISYSFPKTGYDAAMADLRARLDSIPGIHLVTRPRSGRHETVSAVRELMMRDQ